MTYRDDTSKNGYGHFLVYYLQVAMVSAVIV